MKKMILGLFLTVGIYATSFANSILPNEMNVELNIENIKIINEVLSDELSVEAMIDCQYSYFGYFIDCVGNKFKLDYGGFNRECPSADMEGGLIMTKVETIQMECVN